MSKTPIHCINQNSSCHASD